MYLQNHQDDFVGTVLGSNPATYDQVSEGSSKIKEWINMFNDQPTVHSCYGGNAPENVQEKMLMESPSRLNMNYGVKKEQQI